MIKYTIPILETSIKTERTQIQILVIPTSETSKIGMSVIPNMWIYATNNLIFPKTLTKQTIEIKEIKGIRRT